jgi:hypothetical protein
MSSIQDMPLQAAKQEKDTPMAQNINEVMRRTDWVLLASQKAALVKACGQYPVLEGLLCWVDAIQDAAAEGGCPVKWLGDQG